MEEDAHSDKPRGSRESEREAWIHGGRERDREVEREGPGRHFRKQAFHLPQS